MKYYTHSGERGFTLIELMVVVTIIGLLASAILVAIGNTRSRARDARRTSDIRNVMTALELYNTDNGYYPQCGNTTDTNAGTSGCALKDIPELEGYLDKDPIDPRGDDYHTYRYQQTGGTSGGSEGYAITVKYEVALDDTEGENAYCRRGINMGDIFEVAPMCP